MTNIDLATLKSDDEYREDLGGNLWLMDNHKWALWIWENHRESTGIAKFTLVHADHHWDGVYDPHEYPEKRLEVNVATLDQLRDLIDEEKWIRFDSFIAPAVMRGRFDVVHFFCKQDDGGDVGIDDDLLAESRTKQVRHDTVESLAGVEPEQPLIFDLCLDLFNKEDEKMDEGDLWSDDEIESFLDAMRPHIEGASLVTVSLSFGYSGTEEHTRHLAALVMPKLLAWRGLQ